MRQLRTIPLLSLATLAFGMPRELAAGDRDLLPAAPATPTASSVERKVALVIGNGRYQHTGSLVQAPKDADTIEAALRAQGFEVLTADDADKVRMEKAIIDAEAKTRGAAVSLFYYAGHGVQVDGENYLIPVDAELVKKDYVRMEAVPVERVLQAMEHAGGRLNVVVLDACRNNPWAKSWFTDQRNIEASRGLTDISQPGFLIAYATIKGRAAPDDGVYAATLARYLGTPCMTVDEVFQSVFRDVNTKNPDQIPWTEGARPPASLYLGGCATPAPPPVPNGDDVLTVRVNQASYVFRQAADGLWLGETEVTQKFYTAVTGGNPSSYKDCGPDCPVEQVSYVDAAKFANLVSKTQGMEECYQIGGSTATLIERPCHGVRLPTTNELRKANGGILDYAYVNTLDSVQRNGTKVFGPVQNGRRAGSDYQFVGMTDGVLEWTSDWSLMRFQVFDADPLPAESRLRYSSSKVRSLELHCSNSNATGDLLLDRAGIWFNPTTRCGFLGIRLALSPQ